MTAPMILLVDDEVAFVETMAKRLDSRDIETLQAFSGAEALVSRASGCRGTASGAATALVHSVPATSVANAIRTVE